MPDPTRRRRFPALSPALWRRVFWLYALALFIATHWPKAELPGPPGSDKVLHIIVFGLWTILLARTGYFRPVRGVRAMIVIGGIAAAWAGLDELLQEIPFIHRHATIDDYTANLIGVGLGLIGAWALGEPRTAAEPDAT